MGMTGSQDSVATVLEAHSRFETARRELWGWTYADTDRMATQEVDVEACFPELLGWVRELWTYRRGTPETEPLARVINPAHHRDKWVMLVVSVVYRQHVTVRSGSGPPGPVAAVCGPGMAPEILELVGIARPVQDYDAYIFELSSGMRQRVMLITHDLGVVAEMMDDMMVMYLGQAAEYGGVDRIFHAPAHPCTKALLRSIPNLDFDQGIHLDSISGHGSGALPPARRLSLPSALPLRGELLRRGNPASARGRGRAPCCLPPGGRDRTCRHPRLAAGTAGRPGFPGGAGAKLKSTAGALGTGVANHAWRDQCLGRDWSPVKEVPRVSAGLWYNMGLGKMKERVIDLPLPCLEELGRV